MRRLKLKKQQTKIDCGPACLTMVAGYYGYNTSISEFSDSVDLGANGCSMYDMVEAVEKINMQGNAYNASIAEIEKAIKDKEINFPIICHIVSDEKLLHFVVVKKIRNNCVDVFDPGKGHCKIKKDEFAGVFTGNFIEIKPDNNYVNKKKNSKTIDLIKESVVENKKTIIPIYILAFIVLGLELLGTMIYPIMTDYIEKKKWIVMSFKINATTSLEITFLGIGLVLIFCYLLNIFSGYIKGKLSIRFSCSLERMLTEKFYYKTMHMGIDKYKRINTGDILSRCNEIDSVSTIFTEVLTTIIADIVVAVLVFIALINISLKLMICLAVTVAIYIIIVLLFREKIKAANEDILRYNSRQVSRYKEVVDSIKQVKIRRREKFFYNKLQELITDTISAKSEGNKIILLQRQLINFVNLASTIILLTFGTFEIVNDRLSLGTLLMFNAMTGAFIEPLLNLINLQLSMRVTEAAIDRLDSIFYYEDNEHCGKYHNISGNIKISDVSYGYNGNILFDNVNIELEKGKCYGIVGKSGSGKSTLANLIMGLYEPLHGQIMFDDIEVNKIAPEAFDSQIAIVNQDNYFYSESIIDNLFEDGEIDNDLLFEVCSACKVDEFVQDLPFLFDTIMEEGGSSFSTGQKQRLALAKALLKRPKILILDEATSNLDKETEMSIFEYILSLDCTVLCIAHREEIIEKCDVVYKIENKRIIQL